MKYPNNIKETEDTLLTSLGENYEYLRTIVVNSIEVRRLTFLKFGQNVLSKIILILILSMMGLCLLFLLMALLIYLLFIKFNSLVFALLIPAGFIGFIMFFFLLFGKKIINRRVEQSMSQFI